MEREEVLNRVIEVTADVLGCPLGDIREESEFVGDLGAESIQSIELVAAYEVEFDVEMDEDAALQVQTVGDVVEFIMQYLET
ncbi:MAG: acyl carrier protein [Candidatus Brocadiaceae bacterium]|nr:acyl carrier protein [Candidatus Brocadiaceae bacterium]